MSNPATTDEMPEDQSYAAALRLIAAHIAGEDADRPVAKTLVCAAEQIDVLKLVLRAALPGLRVLAAQMRPGFAERDGQVLSIVLDALSLENDDRNE